MMRDKEVISVVDKLNAEGEKLQNKLIEEQGRPWTFTTDGNVQSVAFLGVTIWDSETDARKEIGKCSKCGGSGWDKYGGGSDTMGSKCGRCGGSGTDEPKESLDRHLLSEVSTILLNCSLLIGLSV